MYIPRRLESTILGYLASPEIIAVVGPRQCGKTTMAHHLLESLPGSTALSFDDQATLALFEQHPDQFIARYVTGHHYLFIDEFQYAKHGGKILKYIVDSQHIKIIISGSSAIDLTVKAMKYLVGRILVFPLYPFDFAEFVVAKDPTHSDVLTAHAVRFVDYQNVPSIPDTLHATFLRLYEEYLIFGGYPRVVLEERPFAKQELLRNLYNTYFLREVRDILGLIDDFKLQALLKSLALQIGNLVQYAELGQQSGYTYPSLRRYINFLEKTYACRLVRPWYRNKRTEIVKNPKVYFLDTGMRNSIVNDFRPLRERPDQGMILENGLAMQCIKQGREVSFWRDKKQHEVDFILSLPEHRICALESKSTLHRNDLHNLALLHARYPEIALYCSYQDKDFSEILAPNIACYPVYCY